MSSHNFKDITGQRYGFLTAVRPVGTRETFNKKQNRFIKRAVWLFRCECGKEIEQCRSTFEAYKRQNLTISCGCRAFIEKTGHKHGHWKGCGEIPLTYFNNLKYQAKKSGHRTKEKPFNLTIEYLWKLFLDQNRKCALSGIELCFGTLAQVKNRDDRETLASLDRIDSTKGYEVGNVQWIHKKLNIMKQNLNEQVFIDWCKLVANYQAIKNG